MEIAVPTKLKERGLIPSHTHTQKEAHTQNTPTHTSETPTHKHCSTHFCSSAEKILTLSNGSGQDAAASVATLSEWRLVN